MTYSSGQVARKLGIGISTLSRYMTVGKVPPPQSVTTGGITVYLWTEEDAERLRKLLPKIANGRKTRYPKKQLAISSPRHAPRQAVAGWTRQQVDKAQQMKTD